MTRYTQKELLQTEFKKDSNCILGDLLKPGLYILAANSKVGKTMIGTALANAVVNGSDYLGKSNTKGKVLYFDNDDYDYEAKSRINALNLKEQDDIIYYFGEEASSLRNIKMEIDFSIGNTQDYRLLIIDTLIGLEEFKNSDNNYQSIYPIIKDFRDYVVDNNLVCLIMHHIKKGAAFGQDKLLGTKAITGAATGTILVDVENEYSTVGSLRFMLRHKKEIIPIQKDENGIGWNLLNEEDYYDESIPKNILLLINAVVASKNRKIEGSCQEIVQQTKIEINPMGLYKYLKKFELILNQNNIMFEKNRTREKRSIVIEYRDEN